MGDKHDYLALDWVKGEIEETLRQAQNSLEAYVENPEDSTRMRFCLTYLHQVYGTLQIVEFYGAALLAEEMEKLAQTLLSRSVSREDEALELLMEAILQLPAYLDRVRSGRRDLPIVVLPLLNDLRAVRGDSLLSETALFKPDLESGQAAGSITEAGHDDIPDVDLLLRKIRQLYQFALVGLIRNQDLETNLDYIAKALSRLERLSNNNPIRQLWWVAGALIEGVSAGNIESGTSVKMLLGMIDRQIKQIVDQDIIDLTIPVPKDLIKNLLYYVAKSDSDTPLINAVKDAYKLDEALPGDELIDKERQALTGPDKGAISSVVEALIEELNSFKETLDLFVRGESKELAELIGQLPKLKQVSDTLAVLGLGIPRRVLQEQIDAIEHLADRELKQGDNTLMEVAGALLYVESTLHGLASDGAESGEDDALLISPEQVGKAKEAVLRECRADLEKAKETVIDYINSKWDASHIEFLPELLRNVRGGLNMVPLHRPAELIDCCSLYVVEKLQQSDEAPDWEELDTFADAITSIEYYLERLADEGSENIEILEVAEDSVSQLGYPVGVVSTGHSDIPLLDEAMAESDRGLKSDGLFSNNKISVDDGAIESNQTLESLPEEVSFEEYDFSEDDSEFDELQALEEELLADEDELDLLVVDEPIQVGTEDSAFSFDEKVILEDKTFPEVAIEDDSATGKEEIEEDDLIDEEIIEIFIEEAGEVLVEIDDHFPRWKANTEDQGALIEFRRAFHTLKGSGRMVGAVVIGELAWSIESMLNRIIDNTIDVTDDAVKIVEAVVDELPGLIEHFKNKTKPTLNIQPLEAFASAVAAGENAGSIQDAIAAARTPMPIVAAEIELESELESELEVEEVGKGREVSDSEALAVSEEDFDPVLIEIFSNEAAAHLKVIDGFLKSTRKKEALVTNNVLRAMHTLKGSAHMAGIDVLAEIASPTEKLVKKIHSQGSLVDAPIVECVSRGIALIKEGLGKLGDTTNPEIAGVAEYLEEVARLSSERINDGASIAGADGGEDQLIADGDSHLISIFLAEGMDLIVDAADILTHWQDNPVPGDELDALRRELSMLARSAKTAQLFDVESLSLALEESYSAVTDGLFKPNTEFFEIAHEAHEHLIGMMDRLASGHSATSPSQIVLSLKGCLEANIETEFEEDVYDAEEQSAQDKLEKAVSEGLSSEKESGSAVDISAFLSDDFDEQDPELVEIFLEEANDIAENTAVALQRWINDPNNLLEVEELQRDLHTLKGGARMAEIAEIGDIAHQLEFIYEGLCDSRFSPSKPLFDLLERSHDKLSEMLEKIQQNTSCEPAVELLAEIQKFVANPAEFVAPIDVMPVAEGVESVKLKATPPKSTTSIEMELNPDEIDAEILEIFLEEADELSEGLDRSIQAWLGEPLAKEHQNELQRLLHTIKGGARLAGLTQLGDISHDFETFLVHAQEDRLPADDAFFKVVHQKHDELIVLVETIRQKVESFEDLSELAAGLNRSELDSAEELSERRAVDSSAKDDAAAQDNVVPIESGKIPLQQPLPSMPSQNTQKELAPQPMPADGNAAAARRAPQEMVKVSAELLENLVNLAGETSIMRGRVEQEVSDFAHIIEEVQVTIDRVREQLRRLDIETEATILTRHVQDSEDDEDFDPLELDRYSALTQLSRSLSESVFDLVDLKDTLLDKSRDTETILLQQSRVNTELQEGLMRTRMVPFSRLIPRLRRIVRQVASEVGKNVELEVINAEGEMDRTVLERIVAPLEHMLRNAVDHGIEMPGDRAKAGKPKLGRVTLHLAREGGEVVLRLSDDGHGIEIENIRKQAISNGMMEDSASLTDNEVMQFIFRPGFSTAEKVTQISGRGVGMDVVNSEIKQLGGTVKIHSAPNVGSQFTVRLPFTVAVNRALMVKVVNDTYAIPLTHIEGIVRVNPYELETYYEDGAAMFEYAGQSYRMRYLGAFVHGVEKPNLVGQTKPIPVLLARGSEHSVALQVDSLVGSREIVVKAVGRQLSTVSGLSGATILGDGSVVIILDLVALIRADIAGQTQQRIIDARIEQQKRETIKEVAMPTIMVVDDSVTVRKVTTRLLERNGMQVITAKDGVDAITLLQERTPDLMLLDIEMPRMDGFEVATLVRHDERLKKLPIIMITSRTGEKHRDRALSIGVNKYMGKPFQETELLRGIEGLLGEHA